MHYHIRLLTTGNNKREAQASALSYADELIDKDEFDYYVKQSARTHRLASAAGQEAVKGALAATRREFNIAINAARMMLKEFTDDQIYNDDYPPEPRDYYASRYQFSEVDDAQAYLYADGSVWGGRIRNDKDYQAALENVADGNVWVTSMSFHN